MSGKMGGKMKRATRHQAVKHTRMNVHTRARAHAHARMHAHTHTHTYTHTYTYTCTCTHTPTRVGEKRNPQTDTQKRVIKRRMCVEMLMRVSPITRCHRQRIGAVCR